MSDDTRGLGKLKEEGRDEEVREIASKGGQASPTKFEPGDPRAREAGEKGGQATAQRHNEDQNQDGKSDFYQEIGQKGGQARADDPDVRSGELGRRGAEARWGKDEEE